MKKYIMLIGKLLLLVIAVYVLTFVNSILASMLNYFYATYEQYYGILFELLGWAAFALFNIGIGMLLCFLVHKLPFFRTGYRVLPRKQIFWVIFGLILGFFALGTRLVDLPYGEMELMLRVPLRFIFQRLPCGWDEVAAVPWIGRFLPHEGTCLYCIGVFIGYELFSLFAVKQMQSQKAQG